MVAEGAAEIEGAADVEEAADGGVEGRAEGRMEGEAVVEGFIVIDGSINGNVVNHITIFGCWSLSVELNST